MEERKPGLTKRESVQFGKLLAQLKAEHGCLTHALMLRSLTKSLLAKYLQHSLQFNMTTQERCAIFSGDSGLCQNPSCTKYTSWHRPSFNPFCSKSCAAIAQTDKRKATCLARYGVDHASKIKRGKK